MDPNHFDRLARWWARPLRRRRLLAGVAGLLAGASTIPRGVHAQAGCEWCLTEPKYVCCGNTCCNTDPDTFDTYCASADDGKCCVNGTREGTRTVLCVDTTNNRATCVYDPECQGMANWYLDYRYCSCYRCEEGQIPCRETGTCCNEDQTCGSDGQCVDACPIGQGGSGARANAAAACCKDGEIFCGGTCVKTCPPDQAFNVETCECECSTACGSICCPDGQTCSYDGGAGGRPKCCPTGKACGAACKGDPEVLCCEGGGRNFACVKGLHTCCPFGRRGGPQCCHKGKETCDEGRCVKKKKPKPKKRKKQQKEQSAAGANDQARGTQTVGSFRRTPLTFRKQRRPRSAGSD